MCKESEIALSSRVTRVDRRVTVPSAAPFPRATVGTQRGLQSGFKLKTNDIVDVIVKRE